MNTSKVLAFLLGLLWGLLLAGAGIGLYFHSGDAFVLLIPGFGLLAGTIGAFMFD
jgi:hypothetical protein